MSQNLHHYYLQQMGIEPWLIRKPNDTLHSSKIKLVICSDGQPLESKAISLLNKMLASIGLSSDEVDLEGSGRHPQSALILALGENSAQNLLNSTASFSEMRCKIHDIRGQSVCVSYHPNDLLQQPKDKKHAYQDLLRIEQLLTKSESLS